MLFNLLEFFFKNGRTYTVSSVQSLLSNLKCLCRRVINNCEYVLARKERTIGFASTSILRCEYVGKPGENKMFHKENFKEFWW
jgi:hypothetical protein